jgi:hypothetical protein
MFQKLEILPQTSTSLIMITMEANEQRTQATKDFF